MGDEGTTDVVIF